MAQKKRTILFLIFSLGVGYLSKMTIGPLLYTDTFSAAPGSSGIILTLVIFFFEIYNANLGKAEKALYSEPEKKELDGLSWQIDPL